MKIERIHIDGFGQFEGFELGLGAKMNLVFGPNEAGKSTLLAFIRAILYGFEKRRSAARYQPEKGKASGELRLLTAKGPLLVQRRAGRKAEGELTLRSGSGEPMPESALKDALGGVSRELFCEVFAFGLGELASFERLAAEGTASQALFAAGIEGGQRLPWAMGALRKSTEALFSPKGSTKELNELFSELNEVQAALREVGDRPAEYFRLEERARRFTSELEAIETGHAQAAAARDQLVRLQGALGDLIALERAEASRPPLDPSRGERALPEGIEARLEERLAQKAQAASERDRIASELQRIEGRLAALTLPLTPEAEAELKERLAAFEERLPFIRQLAGKRAHLREKKRQLGTSLEGLGLGLDADALIDVELGAAAKNRLATVRDELAEAERQRRARDEGYQQACAAKERVLAEIRRLTAEQQKLTQTPSSALRRQQAALARLPQIQSELAQLGRERAERQRALAAVSGPPASVPKPLFPAWALVGSGVALAGFVIAAARLATPGMAAAATALAIGLFGLLAYLQRRAQAHVAETREGHARREAERQVQAQHLWKAIAELDERATQLARERAEAASASGVAEAAELALQAERGDALAEQLKQAERREALSLELEAHSAKLADAAAIERSAQTDRDVANAKVSKLSKVLEALTSERKFPQGLSAERALDLWSQAAEVQQKLVDLRAEAESVAVDERACAQVQEALLGCLRAAEVAVRDVDGAHHPARALLEKQARAAQERRTLGERREMLGADRKRAEKALLEAEEGLRTLFAQAGCADEGELRARAAESARIRKAEAELRELTLAVEKATLCPLAEARARAKEWGGPEGISARRSRAEAELKALEAKRTALLDERGRIRQQLEAWEKDTQVGLLRQEEEALGARIQALAERYARDRLGILLLSRARERYQEENQPRVVKLASRILNELTLGKYVRVFGSESGKELWVRDASGKEWGAEALSRGTREQLYLAFRLAVIEDFGERQVPLPVAVDDILVNFDLDRTRQTLKVLARLAERHQIIAFTCHPHLKDLFKAEGAQVLELQPKQQALLRLHSA